MMDIFYIEICIYYHIFALVNVHSGSGNWEKVQEFFQVYARLEKVWNLNKPSWVGKRSGKLLI